MIEHALDEASRICAATVGARGYGLAYGSHATGNAKADSDLDLLFVAPADPGHGRIARLVDRVIAMHRNHGLRLDHEVSYEVKLYADVTQVDAALALQGFASTPDGRLHIPALIAEHSFLNSTPFKLRLIFNALTSPHVWLGGNLALYQRHRGRADRSLGLLALALLDPAESFTTAQAVAVLTHDPAGAAGKDYLGYASGAAVYSALRHGLSRLAGERAVTAIDGARYRLHNPVCRRLVATLAATRPLPRTERWCCDNSDAHHRKDTR